MITIANEQIFGKVVADALVTIEAKDLPAWKKSRCVNAVAKAVARIEQSGVFMDHDTEDDRFLIWSDSNEIYEIKADGLCQCRAWEQGYLCWHRIAKRLVERYNEAAKASFTTTANGSCTEVAAMTDTMIKKVEIPGFVTVR